MLPNEKLPRFDRLTGSRHCIDFPRAGETVYDASISIAGWLFAPTLDPSSFRVRASFGGETIGESTVLFPRPDVSAAFALPYELATGFRVLARARSVAGPAAEVNMGLTVSWHGQPELFLEKVRARLLPAGLERRAYGDVLYPERAQVLHRENIYGSGPPIPDPSPEILQLLRQYAGPKSSVLDLGCGAGAYGPALLADGRDWLGMEVNPACWALLAQRQLPFRKVAPPPAELPARDAEFDDAVCIEVLEHIAEPEAFLREIRRVVRRRALFSVPNMEVLPFFKDWDAVPWHLLEADHKNFFTRTSLRELLARHFRRVEVLTYGEHPLRTRDGIPLHVHLFAIAEV